MLWEHALRSLQGECQECLSQCNERHERKRAAQWLADHKVVEGAKVGDRIPIVIQETKPSNMVVNYATVSARTGVCLFKDASD